MLTKEQSKRWVKLINAMRSGKYKQSFIYLQSDKDTFCPLGLAIELASSETGITLKPTTFRSENVYMVFDANGKSNIGHTLPREIVEYYGFESPSGFSDVDDEGKERQISDIADILFDETKRDYSGIIERFIKKYNSIRHKDSEQL